MNAAAGWAPPGFLESEETMLFLARPELRISTQEAGEAVLNASGRAIVRYCVRLSDEQLRESFSVTFLSPISVAAQEDNN